MARKTTRSAQLIGQQRLPSAGPEREALRQKGQFWTPDWVAQAMVAYVLRGNTDHVFDPAVGAGAFFRAAKGIGARLGKYPQLLGSELDAAAIEEAAQTGLSGDDLAAVELRNFVLHPPARKYAAIVANPPYIRHHRLPADLKAELRAYGKRLMGNALDGRAGLHVYFLLRALELLQDDGRLAFIMPADTCEGKFAPPLWGWITKHYRLDAVVTFAPEATPFPSVDTNALIFMIRKAAPGPTFSWARCVIPQTEQLTAWALSGFGDGDGRALVIRGRRLEEALRTGLSRTPIDGEGREVEPTLGQFAYVRRGIATGDNRFFFLTSRQAREIGVPHDLLRRAIGRTRDVPEDQLTPEIMDRLDASGRPTYLLALDGRPLSDLPTAVRDYLARGEELGLPKKALISQRKPWYRMESRAVPAFLFAYLGRRNARFIRNIAGALPLTGFLCVYPRCADPRSVERLWQLLQHPDTISNLARVGKSYGAGAIKVEPRALEALPIPVTALETAGMAAPETIVQAGLF